MKRQNQRIGLGALIVALALTGAGCSDVDEPTAEDYDNVAESVAPLLAIDLSDNGGATLSAQIALDAGPGWLTVDTDGEARGSLAGVSWDLNSQCTDAGGNSMSVCDSSTDGARVVASVAGDVTLPRLSAGFSADASWAIRGLQSDYAISEGAARFTANSEFTTILYPTRRAFDIEVNASYDLEVATDGSGIRSGSVRATVDARREVMTPLRDSNMHFVMSLEATLDGDGHATVTLDGSVQYDLDLDTGVVVRL